MNNNDFRNYATKHLGMNGLALDKYADVTSNYISPSILEERQLNVTQMDVFSRLMMDRIIFLGTQVDDYTANVIQAQLLYLDSSDPGKDISIYLNTPGGSVYAGLGIYDTMQFISSDVATICTGMAASMGAVLLVAGAQGKRSALKHSRVMIHQPMGGAQGTNVVETASFANITDRIDYGYNFGAGIELFRKVQLGATWSQGLKNVGIASTGLPTATTATNRVLSFNLVYLF